MRQLHLHRGLLVAAVALCAAVAPSALFAATPTESILYSFSGADGQGPYAGLVADATGALYGTTYFGGTGPCTVLGPGCGTVFKLTPPSISGGAWTQTVLYSFSGGADGAHPYGGLVLDANGALYGTTQNGGASGFDAAGFGTVFRLTPPAIAGGPWTETVLHSFPNYLAPGPPDGAYPVAGLIIDAAGSLYGTTAYGYGGTGTVFRLDPPAVQGGEWTESILYIFCPGGGACPDGEHPSAGLRADASGALYGTTQLGGAAGKGAVFRLTPPIAPATSWTETVLHSFTGGTDGDTPEAALAFDASGALYSTTVFGGSGVCVTSTLGCGTVFRLTAPAISGGAWNETILYNFAGSDGANPFAGLITDSAGTLYGTTERGGTYDEGTVFRLARPATSGGAWAQTVLYNFSGLYHVAGLNDGANPYGTLVADRSGSLYGTAYTGGAAANFGIVFKLTVPPAFVGIPGEANCRGKSVSSLVRTFGDLDAAAAALGYASVQALQDAIAAFCK